MALTLANRPFGFRATHHGRGAEVRPRRYTLSTAYNTALYSGDIVKSGTTSENVVVAAAGDTPLGIFDHVEYIDASGKPVWNNYWAASTATLTGSTIYAYVYDDPGLQMEVMFTSIAATDIGQLTNLCDATGAGTVFRLVRVPQRYILDANNVAALNTSTVAAISFLIGEVEFVKHERAGSAVEAAT